jgi:GGDEF domain-containing protein
VTFAPELGAGGDAAPSRWPEWARSVLRPFWSIPEDALDRSTGLYNRSGLFAAANEAARTRGGCELGMVLLDFADLVEIFQIYGNTTARKVVARIVRRLRVLAGLRGFAGRTGPTQFAVVLPGVTQEKARRRIQRVLGRPACVEFDAGDSEIVVVPDLRVDSVEPGEATVQLLYRDMCRELARAQQVELRRLNWLTSERERHSRPMSLPPH